MTTAKYESAERGYEAYNAIVSLLERSTFTEADVAFACALIGGTAIALASNDNPTCFAENVATFIKKFSEHAGKEFGKEESSEGTKK